MDFVVYIDTRRVTDLPDREREALVAHEWEVARKLHEHGILRRLWRLPGQKGNVGIWSAEDADELHEALASLPIWPYITTEVTALATHPLFALIDGEKQTKSPATAGPMVDGERSRPR